jgi:hypothetical protein
MGDIRPSVISRNDGADFDAAVNAQLMSTKLAANRGRVTRKSEAGLALNLKIEKMRNTRMMMQWKMRRR